MYKIGLMLACTACAGQRWKAISSPEPLQIEDSLHSLATLFVALDPAIAFHVSAPGASLPAERKTLMKHSRERCVHPCDSNRLAQVRGVLKMSDTSEEEEIAEIGKAVAGMRNEQSSEMLQAFKQKQDDVKEEQTLATMGEEQLEQKLVDLRKAITDQTIRLNTLGARSMQPGAKEGIADAKVQIKNLEAEVERVKNSLIDKRGFVEFSAMGRLRQKTAGDSMSKEAGGNIGDAFKNLFR